MTLQALYDVSAAGVLVFIPEYGDLNAEIVWVTRNGQARPLDEERANYVYPRLSPDGRRLALAVGSPTGDLPDIYVLDLQRGGRARQTAAGGGIYPAWSPDGRALAFASQLSGNWGVHAKRLGDVTSEGDRLLTSRLEQLPTSWARGDVLAFVEITPDTGQDIWALTLPGDGEEPSAAVVLNSRYRERGPMFSPDGRWLAYVSDQSGRDEIWVRPFPAAADAQMISVGGGIEPVWSRNGRELFYRAGHRLMAVSFDPSTATFGRPARLFEGRYESEPFQNIPNYDVAADGRFLMLRRDDASLPTHFNLVFDFTRGSVPALAR